MLPAIAPPPEIADPFLTGRFASPEVALTSLLARPVLDLRRVERVLMEQDQQPCPVVHRFGPGIYIREVTLPAGCLVVGAKQLRHHLNIMLKGRVTVRKEGGGVETLDGPQWFVGKPGQKVGYVHEDVVWQNVYATDETDIEKLEAMFVDKGDQWGQANARRIAGADLMADVHRADYHRLLAEYGIEHETARAQSVNTSDLIPFPHGSYKVMVTDSPIEGRGLFATSDIEPGEFICMARVGEGRTPAGRYTNHSCTPNARFSLTEHGDLMMHATAPIKGMRGGLVGDEITVDYRQALEVRKQLCLLRSQQQ